jgi:hypothetical protein
MAIKDNVQGVVLALFGASAGGHLAGLTATATASGITTLASDLASSAGFINGVDLSTNAAFRDHFLSGLGITSTHSAYTAAAAWANAELAKANPNRGEIVVFAVNYLAGLTDTTSAFFNAAAAYKARVAAAVTWSEGAGATVFNVADLQAQQGTAGANGTSFTLDSADSVQDFSAYATNVSLDIAGDADADVFDVTGSAFNDTVTLTSYLSASVDAGAGVDTLDLSAFDGTLAGDDADVNLQSGVANAALLGTFINFENVIANEGGGRLVGTSGSNIFTLASGTDDISGAGGNDTILADEDTLNTNDDIDGGSGTDTLVIDALADVNVSTAFDALTNVENISITGTDTDDVTVTMVTLFDSTSTSSTITTGVKNIAVVDDGGDNTVAITSAALNGINLIGVSFTNIQNLDLDASTGTGNIVINSSSLVGVETIDGTAGDQFVLRGGTYDLSSLDINLMTEIDGSSTSNDTLLFGDVGDIADVDLGASTGDVISFKGVDVGDISLVTVADVESLTFGTASRVVVDDGHGAVFTTVTGNANSDDTLVFSGTTVDSTLQTISGVETIVIDGAGAALTLTLGASTLEVGATVIGDSATTDEVILGANSVNLSGVVFRDFETLDFAAKTASISVSTLSNFTYIDGTSSGILTLTDSGALTLTGTMTGAGRIVGFSGDDSWTLSSFSDGVTAVDLRLGSGNDTVTIGSSNTLATALIKLDAGDDTISLGTSVDTVAGTVTGGAGTDTIKLADTSVAALDLLAEDFTGFEVLSWAVSTTDDISFVLGATEVSVSSIDFSADTSSTGTNTINLSAYAVSGYTLTGSAGIDAVTMGAKTSTVNTGSGADTITVSGVALATALEAQTFTVDGGAGKDAITFAATTVTAAIGQHAMVVNNYSADTITITALVAATTSGVAGDTPVELAQTVAQAIVDAASPGSFAAALEALNDHAAVLTVTTVGTFQYDGNTYVYIDGDQGTAYDSTNDFFIKFSGLVSISTTDLVIV